MLLHTLLLHRMHDSCSVELYHNQACVLAYGVHVHLHSLCLPAAAVVTTLVFIPTHAWQGFGQNSRAYTLLTHVCGVQGEGDEEEAKRRRQSARGYQKKFHSSHGDAITALNVLCAYEQSPSPDSFCRSAALHQDPLPPLVMLSCLTALLHTVVMYITVCGTATVPKSDSAVERMP